jgi:hypothetical protein
MARVGFDARGDLALPPGDDRAAIELDGYVDGSAFEHCSFFLDRGVGVWCAAREDTARPQADLGVPERVSFSHCWFQYDPIAARGVALKFAEAGPARLRVDGCAFRGDATAMIAAVCGMLDVSGCDFHNRPASGQGEAGVDLVLGSEARDVSETTRARPLEPLVLNEVHVQSRSERHLRGVRANASGGSVLAITGLVSRRPARASGSAPAVISWRGAVGDTCLIQGSDVSGTVVATDVTGTSCLRTLAVRYSPT